LLFESSFISFFILFLMHFNDRQCNPACFSAVTEQQRCSLLCANTCDLLECLCRATFRKNRWRDWAEKVRSSNWESAGNLELSRSVRVKYVWNGILQKTGRSTFACSCVRTDVLADCRNAAWAVAFAVRTSPPKMNPFGATVLIFNIDLQPVHRLVHTSCDSISLLLTY
jgi:hypothetical protein